MTEKTVTHKREGEIERTERPDGSTVIKTPTTVQMVDGKPGREHTYLRHFIDKPGAVELTLTFNGEVIASIRREHNPTDGGVIEARLCLFPTGKPTAEPPEEPE